MSSPLSRLLNRLEHVKRTGPDAWRCACPAHGEGLKQTLAVRVTDDDRVLLHCFGGCGIDDVLDALGMDLCDLYPERIAGHLPPVRRHRSVFTAADALGCCHLELLVGVATLGAVSKRQILLAEAIPRLQECARVVAEAIEVAGFDPRKARRL